MGVLVFPPEMSEFAILAFLVAFAVALGHLFLLRFVPSGRARNVGEALLFAGGVVVLEVSNAYELGAVELDGAGPLIVVAVLLGAWPTVVAVIGASGVVALVTDPSALHLTSHLLAAAVALPFRPWVHRRSPGLFRPVLAASAVYPVLFLLLVPWWSAADMPESLEVLALLTVDSGMLAAVFALVVLMHRAEAEARRAGTATANFLAAVNHELRTPLTELLGFSEVLEEQLRDAGLDDLARYAEAIARAGTEVDGLLSDLSVASRLSISQVELHTEVCALGDLVAEVANVLGDGVPVRVAGSVWVEADPTRVRQVVRNLLANARDHADGAHEVLVASDDGEGVVRVVDRGRGLAAGLGEEAFEIYRTTKLSTGTVPAVGIGLWLSRSLAELMGGSLVHLVEEGASIFEFRLPTAQ